MVVTAGFRIKIATGKIFVLQKIESIKDLIHPKMVEMKGREVKLFSSDQDRLNHIREVWKIALEHVYEAYCGSGKSIYN